MDQIQQLLQKVQGQFKAADRTIEKKYEHDRVVFEFLKRLNAKVHESSFGKKQFILTEENTLVVDLLCRYMNTDVEFEKHCDKDGNNYSLDKGIFIYGNYGSGKSLLLETFCTMQKEIFKRKTTFNTCQEMNDKFLRMDKDVGRIYGLDGIKYQANKEDEVERAFDDLGAEETTIQNFGNKFCVMAHIFSQRHKGIRNGVKTHGTSNLSQVQLSEVYGGRIESRAFEMFNMIVLGKSSTESIDHRKV